LSSLRHLLEKNAAWAASVLRDDPAFFERLSRQQSPEYLWIGCSDSRVPANQIVGVLPGEMFVHRNIANVVVHTDLNCLSVIQFAVDLLRVKHVIVCGHYGCSGVLTVLRRQAVGLSDNWLRHVEDVREKHAARLEGLADETARHARLCELNVLEQVVNVSHTAGSTASTTGGSGISGSPSPERGRSSPSTRSRWGSPPLEPADAPMLFSP
jgi:carbonic anhydrase